MGRIIEGFWDCPYCGTNKIKGRFRSCQNCGKPRDDGTKFYMDTGNISYVPSEEAKTINKNPDWICTHCNQLNSDGIDTCKYCGSSKTNENLDYFSNRRKKEESEKNNKQNDTGSQSSTFGKFSLKTRFTRLNLKKLSGYIILFVFLVATSIAFFHFLIPKVYDVTIDQKSWEREIVIYQYRTIDESDWTLPSSARLKYSNQEFSHYRQVLDHYETKYREVSRQRIVGYQDYVVGYSDLGNGYFEENTSSMPVYETYYETESYEEPVYRDEPVYLTKYYYEIERWVFSRSLKTLGINDFPYWEETNLLSNERIESQNETYTVDSTTNKEKKLSFTLSFEEWNSLSLNSNVRVKVSMGHGTLIK